MSQWFIQQLEGNIQTEVGPLRPAELLALVRKGAVKPDTRLRKNDSAWFPASEVGGLFEAAVKEEVQYFCPGCNHRVSKPPVTCKNCLRDLGRNEAREVVPKGSSGALSAPTNQTIEDDESQRSVKNWLTKKVHNKKR